MLLQHKPVVSKLVDQVFKGNLNSVAYPSVLQANSQKPERVIVFIVGGATFEEAKELSVNFNQAQNTNRVILGGTNILNSESFLTEISMLKGG